MDTRVVGEGIHEAHPVSVKFQQIRDHLSTFKQKNGRLAMSMITCFMGDFMWGQRECFLLIKNLPHLGDLRSF